MEDLSQTLAIGNQLQHYEIQSVLGEGGFGVTYKAYNTRIKQTVAIKEYLPSDLAFRESSTTQIYARSGGKQEEFAYGLKKFLEEAQTLAQFNHPNIVRAYDFFEENGTGYLVMEYADGQSLGELIKAGGALSEDRITSYFLPLLEGLAEVHSVGLLHRDIKPDNIYIRSNGNSLLIDFGAARQAVGQHSKSVTGIVSQGYAPTEQYGTNAKKQGPWTDIYAIGATLYKCITAETPLDAPTRRDDIHDDGHDPLEAASEQGKGRYSQTLLNAIDQCLQVGIKQRPQSVAELQHLLQGASQDASQGRAQNNKGKDSSGTRPVGKDEAGFDQAQDNKTRKIDKNDAGFDSTPASITNQGDGTKIKMGVGLAAALLLGGGLWLSQSDKDTPIESQGVTQQSQQAQAILDRAQQPVSQQPSQEQVIQSVVSSRPAAEPAPPLEPVNHQLWVNTVPSNARVNLLDQPNHVRYYDGIELEEGQHPIKVTAKGYYAQRLSADLTRGDQTLSVQLDPKPKLYQLSINTIPSEAKIKFVGNDGIDYFDGITLEEGRYSIEVTAKGYQSQTLSAHLTSSSQTLKVSLRPERFPFEPEMVAIPGGSFMMGSNAGNPDEKPVHKVTIKPFKMGKYEVTFEQWDACAAAGGCSHKPSDEGWGRGNRPVINVSYNDITQQYIPWLSRTTGRSFRLPSEAEWEYVARAGTTTKYPWGDTASHSYANYGREQCCGGSSMGRDKWDYTSSVGQFPANAFGVHDMQGNVWEWTQDCWHGSYRDAPNNGNAWIVGGDCETRMLRGGSWFHGAFSLRSASRTVREAFDQGSIYGFRLVQVD